jgi:hypothetical protein
MLLTPFPHFENKKDAFIPIRDERVLDSRGSTLLQSNASALLNKLKIHWILNHPYRGHPVGQY